MKKFLFTASALGLLVILSGCNVQKLPPTGMQGHIEQNPISHILDKPMIEPIQKHMLEHADGVEGAKGGVIVQYNCDDYQCESDLIEKLTTIAEEFDYVYLAPNDYDGKIILTKLSRIEVLDEFDEGKIRDFIAR